jgi:tetratricopeptide (TPR) repeat protein
MESVPVASGVGRIPVGAEVFVGRSGELDRLGAVTSGSGRAVVVHGLGGVGKSTLVARFARLNAGRFSLVWWVTADSPAALDAGLADLAAALAPHTAQLPVEQRVALAVRWLASHEGWLLVLDNLAGPGDAAELLARVRNGTVVVTSRQGVGWRGWETVPLDVLPDEEAEDLLVRIVRGDWSKADLTGAPLLCEELGWLPLAVEQAGAYLAQNRITPTVYLSLLERHPADVFTATAEGGDAQRTMARVWHVTLDRLADTPLAGQVLRQLSWYASESVPRSLLHSAADDSPALLHALGRLAAYSMITLRSETVSVHRLVQAVTRIPDHNDPHRQPGDIAAALRTATACLARVARDHDPRLPASWPHYRLVLPHARALLAHAAVETDTDDTCLLLHSIGTYLHDQGDDSAALEYLTRDCDSTRRLHGPDHADTLVARDTLAGVHMSARDRTQAIELFKANLADRQRILGWDHPHTFTTRDNLAQAYRLIGDFDHALPLFETTLADRERVLGPDHRDTLISRNNVAIAYESVGRLDEAVTILEKALVDSQRLLGPDHPDTLSSCVNLAYAYRSTGDTTRSVRLAESTIIKCEQVMGHDHPHTLAARRNLADTYAATGDLDKAIALREANVASSARTLGADHEHTVETRIDLALDYRDKGDPKALLLFETILGDCEKLFGVDHPLTDAVRANLNALAEGSQLSSGLRPSEGLRRSR